MPALAKTLDGIGRQRKFAARQQTDTFDLIDGALVFRIEGAQRVDFVVEQVDAVGLVAAHRENIEQRAALGEFAVFVDRGDGAIAGGGEAFAQLLDVEGLADVDHQAVALQIRRRRQPVQQCRYRHHQHAAL